MKGLVGDRKVKAQRGQEAPGRNWVALCVANSTSKKIHFCILAETQRHQADNSVRACRLRGLPEMLWQNSMILHLMYAYGSTRHNHTRAPPPGLAVLH